ncbi:MAG: CocE/NonD family hydrolase [Acidobacteriota bacterium]|nr:CocE/NonD family hydrolase [Acidobacteriota bacterium]
MHRRYLVPKQGELLYPQHSLFSDVEDVMLSWYEFWLKGKDTGIMDTPPARAYVMGPGLPEGFTAPGNFWRTSAGWPPPSTETAFYLHAGGLLSRDPPTEAAAETTFTADPNDPVPTLGGSNLYDEIGKGPMDQRPVDDERADVLVWQTPPLSRPVETSGPVSVVLHAASDRPDTDWVIKLEDVYPDGRAMLVTDMILQGRHRLGFDREDLLSPGQVYEFTIGLWDTSITFPAGHAIRIAVASTNYPRFEANPQTGEPFNRHTTTAVAFNRIVHDQGHPSRLLLSVVDPAEVEGCPATAHVTGLTVTRTGPDEVRLSWAPVADACHRRYRVFAGIEGPRWPWIVRRPVAETTGTTLTTSDAGVFWQVVSEGTDGGNGPHGVAP